MKWLRKSDSPKLWDCAMAYWQMWWQCIERDTLARGTVQIFSVRQCARATGAMWLSVWTFSKPLMRRGKCKRLRARWASIRCSSKRTKKSTAGIHRHIINQSSISRRHVNEMLTTFTQMFECFGATESNAVCFGPFARQGKKVDALRY